MTTDSQKSTARPCLDLKITFILTNVIWNVANTGHSSSEIS